MPCHCLPQAQLEQLLDLSEDEADADVIVDVDAVDGPLPPPLSLLRPHSQQPQQVQGALQLTATAARIPSEQPPAALGGRSDSGGGAAGTVAAAVAYLHAGVAMAASTAAGGAAEGGAAAAAQVPRRRGRPASGNVSQREARKQRVQQHAEQVDKFEAVLQTVTSCKSVSYGTHHMHPVPQQPVVPVPPRETDTNAAPLLKAIVSRSCQKMHAFLYHQMSCHRPLARRHIWGMFTA